MKNTNQILIFDLYGTLLEDISIDFNHGLKPLWEEHYKDKCTFDEIKAYGEELFACMLKLHKQGFEFPFVKDELPMYAGRFGGEVFGMNYEQEAEFLNRCNIVRIYDGLSDMLDIFRKASIPMYVLSNSGFRAGALKLMLYEVGIGKYFDEIWSSADFGKVKPSTDFFEMALSRIFEKHPDCDKDDILFTGDTYSTDVTGACRAGIKVAWINRKNEQDAEGIATYQIKEITELKKLI
ncbi:MAG: HAD family hydrolase [Lachnospiraceae bacterium]|nr:HAD family hydrolase [Lachnospiraceae bacterium]